MKLLILLSTLLAVSAWADESTNKIKNEAEVQKEAVADDANRPDQKGEQRKRLDADSDDDGISDVARACGVDGDCDDDVVDAAQENAERKARKQDRKTSRD